MPARPRRFRRLLARVALAGVLSLVVIGAIAFFAVRDLASRTPDWWRPPDASDPETLAAARAVENGITTLLHDRHPPSQLWTMSLSERDANAWLVARLKDWLINRDPDFVWPAEVSDVLLDLAPGTMTLGLSVVTDGSPIVISATTAPRVDDQGSLWFPARSVHVGELSVPAGWLLRSTTSPLRRSLPPDLAESPELALVLQVLAGEAPLARRPLLKLSDGRRVRIVSLRPELDQLLVTCQEWSDEP